MVTWIFPLLYYVDIIWQDEESVGEKEEEEKKPVQEEKEEKAISLFGALKIPGVVEFSLWCDLLFLFLN